MPPSAPVKKQQKNNREINRGDSGESDMAIDEMLDVLSDEWEAGGTGAATGTNATNR